MAMMRKGLTDVNTGDQAVIKQAGDDLGELIDLMNIKVNIEGYHTIPGRRDHRRPHLERRHDERLAGYLPEGTGPEVLGVWQPGRRVSSPTTHGRADQGKNPVLAHLYINHLLDKDIAEKNFEWVGYQPAHRRARRRLR